MLYGDGMSITDVLAGLTTRHAEPIWRCSGLPLGLDEGLQGQLSALVRRFEDGVPIAPMVVPFERGAVMRPAGHRRCYYLRLGADATSSHLGIKGTEPVLVDQLRLLIATGIQRSRMLPYRLSGMDFFPIHEHKVPMMVRLQEALDEAAIGSEIYGAYVRRYGEAPALPFPLAVFKWPQEVTSAYWEVVEPELSPWAREITARLIADGAGCYIYHYPMAPFPRVRHLAAGFRDKQQRRWIDELSAQEDPAVTIERWVRLYTRLLALGYLPCAESQLRNGQAVQAQNTIVRGGFLDLDSLRPLSTISDELELFWSYALSIQVLTATIGIYLFEGVTEIENASGQYDICLSYVYDLIARLAQDDATRYGDSFDPRVRRLPPFSRDLRGLVTLAKLIQGQPRQEDMERALDRRA